MADPIFPPTETIQYPDWQPECRAVMLEIDPMKVREKIAVADLAISKRAEQLTTPNDDPERRAMNVESRSLQAVLAELVQQPDLKK